MGTLLFLFLWIAIGTFLTAFLSGRYVWPRDDGGDFWLHVLSAVFWPITLTLWALIIPAQLIYNWAKPKKP